MADKNLSIYDQIFRHVFFKTESCLILVSQDVSFQRTIKACFKYLGIETNNFFTHHNLTTAVAEAQKIIKRFTNIIFFIEHHIDEKNNILEFSSLKKSFSGKCKIICLSGEVSRDSIVHIYEMGADNVIIKPASVNSIIQKLALTVKPNNKLSEKIDSCQKNIEKMNLDKADELADSILQEKPDSAAGLMLKGDINFKKNDVQQAENFYIQAAKQNKLYLKPLQKLVTLYEAQNNLEKKLDFLKKLDTLSPLNHNRKIKMGETYLEMDQDDEAQQHFDQAVKQVHKQAANMVSSVLMDIAKSVKDKRPEMATEYMARAIDSKGDMLDKEDLWMFNEMGINLRQQNDWEGAIKYYKQALKIAPMDGGLYYNIGMAYLQGGHNYRALQNFEKAIEINPDLIEKHPAVAYQTAMAHYKLKNYPDTERYLKMALKLDPNMENAKKLLQKIRL